MAAVRIQGLRKTFGSVLALDGMDLTVQPNTVFGFLGPNGAGKTTTIRILAGLARPTEGRAWVMGKDAVAEHHEIARRIGYLPEDPAFYPWMTPRELLDHVGRIFFLPAKARKRRIDELLEVVDLAPAGDRRIGGFSRGMRQRLGLAQALVNQPEVLMLDEPVSGLDPVGRKETLELIGALGERCTVFMSTHILTDVERVCDTVGVINQGRLVAGASREELISRYALPVFEMEWDRSSVGQAAPWLDELRNAPWVNSVSVDDRTVRVVVNDKEKAKRVLMNRIVQAGVVLTRYELVRPSLEDVFFQLIGEREEGE